MNTERRRRLFEDPVSLSFSFSSESSIEISRRIIPFISQLGPLIVNREENVARREREEGRSSKLWRTAENGRGNHLLQFKALSRVAFFLLDSYIYLSLRPRRAILLSFHPSSPRIERWRTLSKYEERKSLRIIFHLLEENLSDDKQSTRTELFQRGKKDSRGGGTRERKVRNETSSCGCIVQTRNRP